MNISGANLREFFTNISYRYGLSAFVAFLCMNICSSFGFQSFQPMIAAFSFFKQVIKNIRVVKSYGWQSAFLDKIFSSRAAEIALLRIVALLRGLITMILQATPVMVSLCTFALHTYTADEPLTAVQVRGENYLCVRGSTVL